MKILESRIISKLNEPIGEARYSPSGELLVGIGGIVGHDGCVCVWRVGTLERVANFSTERPIVTSLALSRDGQWFATACQLTDSVEIWDANSLRLVNSITIVQRPDQQGIAGGKATETQVSNMAFSSDSRQLAAACWDLTAKVIDLETGAVRELRVPHDRYNVEFVAFVADGALITGTRQRLFSWDPISGTQKERVDFGKDGVWKHLFLTGTNSILSLSGQGEIRVHHLDGWASEEHTVRIKPQRLPPSVAYSSLLRLLAIGLFDGTVLLWDVSKRKQVDKFKAGPSPVVSLDFSPTGSVICVVALSPTDRVVEYTLSP